jgi:hypothetical protein
VVLVTDGDETSGPDVMSVLPALKEEGVIVTVVVLGGPPSEELEQLARKTGKMNHLVTTFFMDTQPQGSG